MISIGNKIERIVHFLRRNMYCAIFFKYSKLERILLFAEKGKKVFVRSGIRTHAHIRGPEHSVRAKSRTLESGALDRSAILTCYKQ